MPIKTPKDFDRMVNDILKEADKSLDVALQKGRNEAVKKAPVDTGNLRASIRAERTGPLSGHLSVLAQDKDSEDNTNYAFWVEYGTVKMSARPFMAPGRKVAFRELQEELKEIIRSKRKEYG